MEVFIKSGIVEKNPVISMIMKYQKHRWLKTHLIKEDMTKSKIEAVGLLYALRHIKPKYHKKKIKVYTDSHYLKEALQKKKGKYKNKTSVAVMESLRDYVDGFPNITLHNFPDGCEDCEELMHVYLECGLDGIELDEKEPL